MNLTLQAPSKETEPQNCWEFMNCPEKIKNQCYAYILKSGKDCFFLSDMEEGGLFSHIGGCLNCEWFKKNNSELTNMIQNVL